MRVTAKGVVALTLLLLTGSSTMRAQSSPSVSAATGTRVLETGKVSGVVFDSVMKRPMADAQVWLPGTTIAATTDNDGKFELDSVPVGKQTLAYSSPVLDSIGLGTRGRIVEVSANAVTRVTLGAPSVATMWRVLCKDKVQLGPDSGIVWGTVTDAHTGARLSNAPATFTWYDLKAKSKKFDFAELRAEVRSDTTGTFYACGLPTDVVLSTRAIGNKAASGEVQIDIGERSLHRVDLSVSEDLAVLVDARLGDTAVLNVKRPHGKATMRGTVRDNKANPIANALISVSSMDTTVRTNSKGEFFVTAMPSGTLEVSVRIVGYGRSSKLVDLRPEVVTDVDFTLGQPNTLATYTVRAERKISMEEADFLDRRKSNIGGMFINMEDMDYGDAISPLRNVPRVFVTQNGPFPTVTMARPGNQGNCTPLIYVNGSRITADLLNTVSADDMKVVEVYNNWMLVPPRYMGSLVNPCGVILYWSSFSMKK